MDSIVGARAVMPKVEVSDLGGFWQARLKCRFVTLFNFELSTRNCLLRRVAAFGDGAQDDLALVVAVFADVRFCVGHVAADDVDQQALEDL